MFGNLMGSGFANADTRGGPSGKRYPREVRRFNKACAGGGAVAEDDVDYPRGKTGFINQTRKDWIEL